MDKKTKVSGGAAAPRVRLRQALLELIALRAWQRIRVGEICARAKVARSTFYQHFAHKEELLLSGFDELKQQLSPASLRPEKRRVLAFLPGLVAHAAENRRMFLKLVGCGAGALPTYHFRMFVLEMAQEDLFGGKRPPSASELLRARYVAGGIAEVLMWWLQDAPSLSGEEICSRCVDMTLRIEQARI
jgi:AcrR family transcriptional regulator